MHPCTCLIWPPLPRVFVNLLCGANRFEYVSLPFRRPQIWCMSYEIDTLQYLKKAGGVDGAVIVSTPQEVALTDVRKEISFCRNVSPLCVCNVYTQSRITCCCVSFAFPPRTCPPCTNAFNFVEPPRCTCMHNTAHSLRTRCPAISQQNAMCYGPGLIPSFCVIFFVFPAQAQRPTSRCR